MKSKIIDVVAILIMVFLLCILGSTFARAETMVFSWTANPPGTEGYRMYMDTGDNVVADNIPREVTTYTLVTDLGDECHNFWLRAYDGNIESDNSDIAIACPVSEDPDMPIRPINVGGFTVTISVDAN